MAVGRTSSVAAGREGSRALQALMAESWVLITENQMTVILSDSMTALEEVQAELEERQRDLERHWHAAAREAG